MRLTVLGCQGPYPGPGGATSGYLLEAGETRLALDLGTGCLAALTALTAPERLTGVVFSHWHFDHCSDVLPLLYRLQAAGAALDVWAPEDPDSIVRRTVAAADCFRLHTLKPGDALRIGGLELCAFAARHPVPGLMLRLSDGNHTMAYTGDTNLTADLPALAAGADLLLADALFPHEIWAEAKPHLSARLAGELARDAGAKRLVITHMRPDLDAEALLREARAAFPQTELAMRGAVFAL